MAAIGADSSLLNTDRLSDLLQKLSYLKSQTGERVSVEVLVRVTMAREDFEFYGYDQERQISDVIVSALEEWVLDESWELDIQELTGCADCPHAPTA